MRGKGHSTKQVGMEQLLAVLEKKMMFQTTPHLEAVWVLGRKLLPLFQTVVLVDGSKERELGRQKENKKWESVGRELPTSRSQQECIYADSSPLLHPWVMPQDSNEVTTFLRGHWLEM